MDHAGRTETLSFASGEALEEFRILVEARLGLRFEDNRVHHIAESLCRRLAARRLGMRQYLDLLGAPHEFKEWRALAEELTVTETYFFRHHEQFRAFSDTAVPACLQRREKRSLNILSAGCASGEEAYSLAMLIDAAGLDPACQVSITGIDINRIALEKAALGQYSAWTLRETPPDMVQRWFRPQSNYYILDARIRAMVSFDERNLAGDSSMLWPAQAYDIVFCRNVLMYFNPALAAKIVRRIAAALVPGGYLFLGHAENLRGLSEDFDLCQTEGGFYYRRRDNLSAQSQAPVAMTPQHSSLHIGSDWAETIREATERVQSMTPPPAAALPALPHWDLQQVMELLQTERYNEALEAVAALPAQAREDNNVLLLQAVLLTHTGKLDEAAQACARLLEDERHNASAQYVLALCRAAAGDFRAATEHDQLAIGIDPSFAMPRLHLGLLARKDNDLESAHRELQLALGLLEREEASRLLLFGGGFSRSALLNLCRAELGACRT